MITATSLNTDPALFQQEGYYIVREVIPPTEIQATRQVLGEAIAHLPTRRVWRDGVEVEVEGRPEYMTEPHTRDAFWLELCCHPRVLDAVENVLGPDILLIMSHLIVKRPKDGLRVDWHQDNTTWPAIQGTDVVTVWLAIDDADAGNGAMKVIPSSHEGYPELEKHATDGTDLLGLVVAVTPEMEASAVSIDLDAGDISIHDSYILHGSQANTSDRRRAGYTMRYANALTTSVDVDTHFAPLYLVRGKPDESRYSRYLDVRPATQA